jgi:cytochrome bd ubiquinol oxidase subunit II
MLRAVGIEFRSHIDAPVWTDFFDVAFAVASTLLCVFIGAALGNVVRGVPLDASGYFFEPLWTDFKIGAQTGILDWYKVLTGIVALVTLTAHGSHYVALKTDEDLGRRAKGVALLIWPLQIFLTCIALVATYFVRPEIMLNYQNHKIGLLVPIVVFASLGVILWATPKGKEKTAFVASSLYIAGMLVGAAFALYPVVLPARAHQFDLTISNTSAGAHGLSVGLVWWTLAAVLTVAYFVFVYRMFRGKVQLGEGQY